MTPTDEERGELQRLRDVLVDDLVAREYIRTKAVEDAFRAVPRHVFVPHVPAETAYSDRSVHISATSSSSQPAIMAAMLEQLALEPGMRVLEIGAGSGYNAALIAKIVGTRGHVVTIDIDEDLVAAAIEHLLSAGVEDVDVVCADGGFGHRAEGGFDRVIVTAGASDIAPAWHEQLKPGGRLVVPLAVTGNVQVSAAFVKVDERFESDSVLDCGFIMLQGAFSKPESVVSLASGAGFFLSLEDPERIDLDDVDRWLRGSYTDRPTGVVTTAAQVWGPLSKWLALREPEFCSLNAWGNAAVDEGLVPLPPTGSSDWKMAQAGGLVSRDGLCLLAAPSHAGDGPSCGNDDEKNGDEFELFVRCHGNGDDLGERLVASVHAWQEAGRPGVERLHVRAYPAAANPRLAAGETLLARQWCKLVFSWTDTV
jgi:protein-L-isoaspartate(D-aspartate) O-methyltransferase